MKKLLMLGAILALGTTMAYGNSYEGEADVKVRAEITDDTLVITDLNGNPIVLDFGKISNKSTGVHNAEVGYKVTWGSNVATGATSNTLKMELGGQDTVGKDGAKKVRIYYGDKLEAGYKETSFNTIVGLDKYSFELGASPTATEYTGKVLGTIDTTAKSDLLIMVNGDNNDNGGKYFKDLKPGEYIGETTLTVTLTTAGA